MSEISGASIRNDQNFLFTNESDRQNVCKNKRIPISLNDFILLQIKIIQEKQVFGLYYEWNFPSIMKIIIITDVNFVNFKPQINDMRLRNDRYS